jgi:hypothetical protein
VADFRDSMTEENYPPEPRRRAIYRRIESQAVTRAASCVFTSPGTVAMYRDRYPHIPQEKWKCILNGYDEQAFAPEEGEAPAPVRGCRLTLLHSGLLYPSERDPRPFFAAIRELSAEGAISPDTLLVNLRASGYEEFLQSLIDEARIGAIVKLAPAVGYREALSEMVAADGLLIFQASNCNHQIPAKLYEYIRARRPVLALTDPVGDTAGILAACGVDTVVRIDSTADIKRGLRRFLDLVSRNVAPVPGRGLTERYSRRNQTGELARLFDTIA